MTAIAPDGPLPVAPPSSAHVGMIGGGALARLTHQAAVDLGITLEVLARSGTDPAVLAGASHLLGPPGSIDALRSLADRCDVVTSGHDDVPVEHLDALRAAGHTVRPRAEAVRLAQDALLARQALDRAGFPVPRFTPVDGGGSGAVESFAERWGWPVVMKPRHGGHDRRDVHVLHDLRGVGDLLTLTPPGGWVLETHVSVARELTVLVARNPSGHTSVYPVVETRQRDGVWRELVMPAMVSDEIADAATRLARSLADGIDATGVLAVGLLLTSDDGLVVNEVALGPHSSGHATIEATLTSQFHNHLRGILDWPLGSTEMLAPAAATVNVVGAPSGADPARHLAAALAVPSAHVHLYARRPRPGRELGHVTALGDDPAEALDTAQAAARRLVGS